MDNFKSDMFTDVSILKLTCFISYVGKRDVMHEINTIDWLNMVFNVVSALC